MARDRYSLGLVAIMSQIEEASDENSSAVCTPVSISPLPPLSATPATLALVRPDTRHWHVLNARNEL